MAGLPGTMMAVWVEVSEKDEDSVEWEDMTANTMRSAAKGVVNVNARRKTAKLQTETMLMTNGIGGMPLKSGCPCK